MLPGLHTVNKMAAPCHDSLELVSNLDFVAVHIKQLDGDVTLDRLGLDPSRITLPIYGYRMQLSAWRPELVWYTHLMLPSPDEVLPKQLSVILMRCLFSNSICSGVA